MNDRIERAKRIAWVMSTRIAKKEVESINEIFEAFDDILNILENGRTLNEIVDQRREREQDEQEQDEQEQDEQEQDEQEQDEQEQEQDEQEQDEQEQDAIPQIEYYSTLFQMWLAYDFLFPMSREEVEAEYEYLRKEDPGTKWRLVY